jgi:hypothetical protein
MSAPDSKIDQPAPPARGTLAGTRLVHYGPLWDADLEAVREERHGPVAVLVCHGMGQQVRYETISSLAHAIRTEAAAEGGAVRDVEVHLSKLDDSFLARAEIAWTDVNSRHHSVHVYEAYWAPLTEGRVTYWDTLKFLFAAGWNGLCYSVPLGPHTFRRWVFGGPKEMRIGRATFFALCGILAFLVAQVAIIGFVLVELAREYRTVLAQPTPWVHLHELWSLSGLWTLIYAWLRWLGPFFPDHSLLIHSGLFSRVWWSALVKLVGWFMLVAEVLLARYFLIEYVGDVAAYVSPYKDSKFDELRQKIQKVGLDVGKIIYGFGPPNVAVPRYDKIVVVGHSLGSVLAYDTVNALINLDNVSATADQRGVVQRTRALLTFGSPLDKTAFIFRTQVSDPGQWIREQLVASVQPLVLAYAYRPVDSFEWFNIWSPMDIISGELNYYDDSAIPADRLPHIINRRDPQAWLPLAAHVQYWNNPMLRRNLLRFVTS